MACDAPTIPPWWPQHGPIYDIDKTYAQNSAEGPFVPEGVTLPARPPRPPKDKWMDLLGYKVASPLGIPAGPLLNSRWTTFAARAGFDIITYKTIRSQPTEGHAHPNVVYIDTRGPLSRDRLGEVLKIRKDKAPHIEDVAITNSFGMPSRDKEYLRQDIRAARDGLEEGQVLIVSVVGTPGGCNAPATHDFFQDFVDTAVFAAESGAQIIEANFSCPNVVTGEGKLYGNPDVVYKISSRIVHALPLDIPLVIKVGVFDDFANMRQVFWEAARAGVQGICGINTLSMKVVDEEGEPALGPGRVQSGICGGPIRMAALEWTRLARRIIDEEHLPLTLMTCGGAMSAKHLDEFLSEGSQVAMTATGMMWDPLIAMRWHEAHNIT